MWWVDVLGIGAAIAGWGLIPRWVEFTTSFYRDRGLALLAPALMGRAFVMVIRGVCVLIAVFATIDLIRNLT